MPTITERYARRHEALVLRLEALAAHVGAVAARQPEFQISAAVRALAADLVCDCRPFVRGLGRLPPIVPTYGGLSVQLGEARARLEAFELRHSGWDNALNCVVWRTEGGSIPVARLHPKPALVPETQDPEVERVRAGLARRIDALYRNGYDDALAGRPPRR